MRRLYTLAMTLACATAALAQPVFTNASANLDHSASSGACMAVADMDGDGLDDIVMLDMSQHVYIQYQNPDHSFVTYDHGQVDNDNQWGWAMADLNNDGHKDICSGVSVTKFLSISSRGVYTFSDLNGPTIFTQAMSMADFDNDGRVDVYACNDVGPNNIWITDANGVPQYDANVMDWSTSCSGTPGDMSGNYGSTVTDFDNDGDVDLHISHCRQGVNDPDDCRRWDRLFVNDGNGNYSDDAAAYGLENREQVWTSDFGDYDNDGDLDVFSTTHSSTMMLFENDGTGHYTDVTAGSGLEVSGFFLQGLFRDLDNDAHLDILTGSAEYYMKGNGDGTFTQINNVFPANKTIHSFAFGDFNSDGFEDVYAGYGDGYVDGDPGFPDRLWLNTPNGNHWLNVNLEGVVSNRDAVGSRVTIYGPWGIQIREVHAGESYGITNTFTCHFGLGAATQIDSVVINWTSGIRDVYPNMAPDQTVTVLEGVCVSPIASITGPAALCTGQTVTLTANSGFTYLWSTNETTQNIDVSSGGTYTVTIDDGTGCTGTTSFTVEQDPDETPTITLNGDENFCEGESVVLTSSTANAYLWSTNETTQSITVTTAGTYSVSITGFCANVASDPVTITVADTPDAPTATDVYIPAPGTANLNATGTNVLWYDAAVGGNQVGAGNSWTTPFLNFGTTFWCADVLSLGDPGAYGGKVDNDAVNGQFMNNNNNYLTFDATQDFRIVSVKVYANGAGDRDIELVDDNGNTILTGTFTIPDGESRVQLDFDVPAGTGYSLRCGTGNPQLWRDGLNSNPAFPFALGTFGTITGTSVGGGNSLEYYYYFYDWEVADDAVSCASPRTEVVVDVANAILEGQGVDGLNVWPNPTNDLLNISFASGTSELNISLTDISGRVILATQADGKALGAGVTSLNLGGLSAGTYMLNIANAKGRSVQRVVVR
ncbi:MAG: VCBS repeat-containing protein [Flavobacteriales bacterium]|nr:VCBS repeat-containing protein [Flavobacteriales bacterium]